jgi:hypothetical protein
MGSNESPPNRAPRVITNIVNDIIPEESEHAEDPDDEVNDHSFKSGPFKKSHKSKNNVMESVRKSIDFLMQSQSLANGLYSHPTDQSDSSTPNHTSKSTNNVVEDA